MLTRRVLVAGFAGTLVGGWSFDAQARRSPRRSPAPNPPPVQPKPLPYDPGSLRGLSERLLRSHHQNNYGGAVRKLNATRARLRDLPADAPGFVLGGLKAQELAFSNSVVLHELYFSNLGGGARKSSPVRSILDRSFGGPSGFERELKRLGATLGGGSGWAILGYDTLGGELRLSRASDHSQFPVGHHPLLVLDMYEHSYHMEFGTKVGPYLDAFWTNINWSEVERRYERAKRP